MQLRIDLLQRELHVLGGEGMAVVPPDVRPQLERIGEAVRRDLEALRKVAADLAIETEARERAVARRAGDEAGNAGAHRRIEEGRILLDHADQALGLIGTGGPAAGERCDDEAGKRVAARDEGTHFRVTPRPGWIWRSGCSQGAKGPSSRAACCPCIRCGTTRGAAARAPPARRNRSSCAASPAC